MSGDGPYSASARPQLSPASLPPFLSRSVDRNRPRAILFSHRARPSLGLKLVAFATRASLDVGFVSLAASFSPAEEETLRSLGVSVGQRRLAVVREYLDNVWSLTVSSAWRIEVELATRIR